MIPYTQMNGHNVLAAGNTGHKAAYLPAVRSSKSGKAETDTMTNFGEDFMQEHCLSAAADARKAGNGGHDLHDCPQAFGFPC